MKISIGDDLKAIMVAVVEKIVVLFILFISGNAMIYYLGDILNLFSFRFRGSFYEYILAGLNVGDVLLHLFSGVIIVGATVKISIFLLSILMVIKDNIKIERSK